MPGLAPMLHFEICFWIQNWCSNVSLFLPYTKYTKALLYFPPTKAQNTNKGSKNFVCPTWHDRKESPSKATKNHPIKYKKPFLVDTSHCSFQANECSHVTHCCNLTLGIQMKVIYTLSLTLLLFADREGLQQTDKVRRLNHAVMQALQRELAKNHPHVPVKGDVPILSRLINKRLALR